MSMPIQVNKTVNSKQKPDMSNLGFGTYFTDHMFIMDYSADKGWHSPRIEPYAPIPFDPSIMAFHYGQAVFEGMKAYKSLTGKIQFFRPKQNVLRLNQSNERLCMPALDVDFAFDAIRKLVEVDQDWIPTAEGASLYIRPFVIAVDPYLGVRPSLTYKFIVIMSPVGLYYPEGLNPVKIFVEPNYVRAVRGGIGFAKAAGNYAASLLAQKNAKEKGYSQVLWLDAIEKKYVEEVGTMNVFFKINDEVITPPLEGSILPGITRDSVIQLLKSWNIKVVERRITIDEVYKAYEENTLVEAFGTGTAAIIAPIGELIYNENKITLNDGKIGELSSKVYQTMTDIQFGREKDTFNWIVEL